jgi:hypothetical protein
MSIIYFGMEKIFVVFIFEFLFLFTQLNTVGAPTALINPHEAECTSVDAQERGNNCKNKNDEK